MKFLPLVAFAFILEASHIPLVKASHCGGIVSFNIINADTDTVFLGPLVIDQKIDEYVVADPLSTSDLHSYSIEAVTVNKDCEDSIRSVQFCIDGKCHCENAARWALFGNSDDDFYGRDLVEGDYHIEATPFGRSGCSGQIIDDFKILQFSVISTAPTDPPALLPTDPPVSPPTDPPEVDIYAHCEEPLDSLSHQLRIQELQSPPGPRHSDGILSLLTDTEGPGTNAGLVWFSNDIVEPVEGVLFGFKPLGTQTGHCVLVEVDMLLACYFNFKVESGSGRSGRITAEALFDMTQSAAANLVITGGTGDFKGITGHGCTSVVPGFPFDGTTFIYNFAFDL